MNATTGIASRRITAALLLLTLVVGLARAESDDDQGLWLMALGQGSFGNADQAPSKLLWWLDVQTRFSNEADGLGQTLVRPGIGYAINDHTTLWLGYAWIRTTPSSGEDSDEHRIWQQLIWSKPLNGINFLSRTRLEQRFHDNGSDTGWRLRQFMKASYPLPGNPNVSLVAYDELFFGLNDTDWGTRSGFDRNRLFLGVGWRLGTSGHSMEIGYLNQYVDSASEYDLIEHILSLNLFMNY